MHHDLRAFVIKSTQSFIIKITKARLVDIQGVKPEFETLADLLSVKHDQPQLLAETNL